MNPNTLEEVLNENNKLRRVIVDVKCDREDESKSLMRLIDDRDARNARLVEYNQELRMRYDEDAAANEAQHLTQLEEQDLLLGKQEQQIEQCEEHAKTISAELDRANQLLMSKNIELDRISAAYNELLDKQQKPDPNMGDIVFDLADFVLQAAHGTSVKPQVNPTRDIQPTEKTPTDWDLLPEWLHIQYISPSSTLAVTNCETLVAVINDDGTLGVWTQLTEKGLHQIKETHTKHIRPFGL